MKRTRTLRTFSLFQKIVATGLTVLIPIATMPELALALPHGGVVSKGSTTLGYSTALAIKVASNQIVPVVQTVDNFQSLPSLPGISSVAPSTNDSASSSSLTNTSSSSTQTTLADSGNSSVKVFEPVETGDVQILSVEKVTT
jgi:hypothetical protein